jgi:hypothetical protein
MSIFLATGVRQYNIGISYDDLTFDDPINMFKDSDIETFTSNGSVILKRNVSDTFESARFLTLICVIRTYLKLLI